MFRHECPLLNSCSTKYSLQFLSIPIYTIFKNLTIILIAYGEVLWFGSKVTPIMLLSFLIMVSENAPELLHCFPCFS